MNVPEETKLDDVLISLSNALETSSPRVKAISGRVVGNENGRTIDLLELVEFINNESKLLARVVPLLNEIPVLTIAGLGVDTNDLKVWNLNS